MLFLSVPFLVDSLEVQTILPFIRGFVPILGLACPSAQREREKCGERAESNSAAPHDEPMCSVPLALHESSAIHGH